MVTRTKKIFVGGLSASTVVEDVKQYFEQFGKVRSEHHCRPTDIPVCTSSDFHAKANTDSLVSTPDVFVTEQYWK